MNFSHCDKKGKQIPFGYQRKGVHLVKKIPSSVYFVTRKGPAIFSGAPFRYAGVSISGVHFRLSPSAALLVMHNENPF